jgi:hypothetical protein
MLNKMKVYDIALDYTFGHAQNISDSGSRGFRLERWRSFSVWGVKLAGSLNFFK